MPSNEKTPKEAATSEQGAQINNQDQNTTEQKNCQSMNIYQKMLEATNRINRVAKNLKVGVGNSQYKAVGEADVLEAVKPIEVELGIYSFPLSRKIIDTNVFTTTSEYNGKTTEKNNLFMRLETVYRFINTDNPDEFVDITTYGDGVDPQDKAPGKAMTYSDKYALLKAYKIETGEDPDQKASEPMKKADRPADPPQAVKDEADKIAKRKINSIELDAFQQAVEETQTDIDILFKLMNYVGTPENMTFGIWKEAMTKIDAKKAKMAKNQQKLDLGLE